MLIQGRVLVHRDEDGQMYTTRQQVTVSSVFTDMILASVAATGATILVHPFDMAKVRIQMQGELQRRGEYKIHYRNVPHAMFQIMRYDGVRSIYRGIIPAASYQIISQGFRLGLFQTIEDLGITMDENLEPSVLKSAVSGAFCGAVSAFLAAPFFMVKSYLMIKSLSEIRIAHQRKYANMAHAFYDIYRSYPLERGLWRATGSNVLRVGVGSAVQLSTFVGLKNVLSLNSDYNERFIVFNTLLAALASSIIVSPIIASFDLIRARMYIQPVDVHGRGLLYKNVWDCIRQIKAREGMAGFWKGSTGAFFYVMITSSITLVSWDEMRHVRNSRLNSRDYLIDFGYG